MSAAGSRRTCVASPRSRRSLCLKSLESLWISALVPSLAACGGTPAALFGHSKNATCEPITLTEVNLEDIAAAGALAKLIPAAPGTPQAFEERGYTLLGFA